MHLSSGWLSIKDPLSTDPLFSYDLDSYGHISSYHLQCIPGIRLGFLRAYTTWLGCWLSISYQLDLRPNLPCLSD